MYTLSHLELCLSGVLLLGLAHLFGGMTRVYIVGWFAISFGWILLLGRSSISDVVLDLGNLYKEALLGFLPHEGFPG